MIKKEKLGINVHIVIKKILFWFWRLGVGGFGRRVIRGNSKSFMVIHGNSWLGGGVVDSERIYVSEWQGFVLVLGNYRVAFLA